MISSRTLTDSAGLERVQYFPRQLLTADDMRAEQEYFRQKLRRHNRFLHGWGVVCGCEVTQADPGTHGPWRVWLCPGYVVTPHGDEIWIQDKFLFDLTGDRHQAAAPCEPHPCPPSGRAAAIEANRTLFLAVRYVECDARPVRVHPVGCACDEAACEYSRVRESFELALLTEVPEVHEKAAKADADWCQELQQWAKEGRSAAPPTPACPACSDEAWVVLAAVTRRRVGNGEVLDIRYHHPDSEPTWKRRVLYSAAALRFCCEE